MSDQNIKLLLLRYLHRSLLLSLWVWLAAVVSACLASPWTAPAHLPMRCWRPWPGDTDQVGRLAGAPPRAPGRRGQTGRRLAGARPGGLGGRAPRRGRPTAPPTPPAALPVALAPCGGPAR